MKRVRTAPRLGALLATCAVLVAGGQAAAQPVVPVPMHVHVTHSSTSFSVCGSGRSLSSTNVWVMRVTGARVSGSPVNETVVSFQPAFDYCVAIPKDGAAAGAFTVSLTFAGSGPDVTGTFGGYGAWAPGVADQAGDTGIG